MNRHLLPLACVFAALATASLSAQDDGQLYNPPEVRIRGYLNDGVWAIKDVPNVEPGIIDVPRPFKVTVEDLLPILFFPVGSAVLEERYRLAGQLGGVERYADTGALLLFPLSHYIDDFKTRQKYYELLDIVGYRLRKYPDARLQIEGGYSAEPTESAELGALRAATIRDYLLATWGIAPDRLVLLSSRRYADSTMPFIFQEEARRVTLTSNDPRIVRRVRFNLLRQENDYLHLDIVINPRFAPQDVAAVEVTVRFDGEQVYQGNVPFATRQGIYRLRGVMPIHQVLKHLEVPNIAVVAEAVVTLRNGRRYLSTPVGLHLREKIEEDTTGYRPPSASEIDDADPTDIILSLPYFNGRDSSISPAQIERLPSIVRRLDSIVAHPPSATCVDSIIAVAVEEATEQKRRSDSYHHHHRDTLPLSKWDSLEWLIERECWERRVPVRRIGEPIIRVCIVGGCDATEINPERRAAIGGADEQRLRLGWRGVLSRAADSALFYAPRPQPMLVEDNDLSMSPVQWIGFDFSERRKELELEERAQARHQGGIADYSQQDTLSAAERSAILALGQARARSFLNELRRVGVLSQPRVGFMLRVKYVMVSDNEWIYPEARLGHRKLQLVFVYDNADGVTPNRNEER